MTVAAGVYPEPAGRAEASVQPLLELVATDLEEVNRIIFERMESPVELIPQLAGYIIASGGKRLRPLLTLATAKLCGYTGRKHLGLAGAVEFIHTATLLHDDVVDESDLRRGQASANEVFGNEASVLVGDFLFARAFQLMVEAGSLEVLRILSDASALIAEGEVMQLAAAHDVTTTEAIYLRVVRAKTAELFAAACQVGAVVAERDKGEVQAVRDFGMNLGIAFQLVDDVLDYSALQARLGKSIGDDFREGKITLPVVLANAAGSDEERAFWRRTLERQEQTDDDLEQAIRLVRRHGALDQTIARAHGYGALARQSLQRFPDGPIRRALLEVVDFAIGRDY